MTKYLMPCTCGAKIEVDANQAGLPVSCVCGKNMEVPTLRGLKSLPQAAIAPQRNEAAWGAGQGLLFLGAVILLVGLAGAGWMWRTRPPEQMLMLDAVKMDKLTDSLSPAETWGMWAQFRQGLNRVEHPALAEIDKFKSQHELKLYAFAGVALVGVAVMAAAAAVPRKRPSKA